MLSELQLVELVRLVIVDNAPLVVESVLLLVEDELLMLVCVDNPTLLVDADCVLHVVELDTLVIVLNA